MALHEQVSDGSSSEIIRFNENFVSGCSERSFLTRVLNANNCLQLVLTASELRVRAMPLFQLLSPLLNGLGLQVSVPLGQIEEISIGRYLFWKQFRIAYRDALDRRQSLRLVLRKTDEFESVCRELGLPLNR